MVTGETTIITTQKQKVAEYAAALTPSVIEVVP
jgi:hypothetical protein